MPLQGPFRGRVERGGAVRRLRRGGSLRPAVGDHGRRDDGAHGVADDVLLEAGAVPRLLDGEVGGGVGHHQAGGDDRGDPGNLHGESPRALSDANASNVFQ